MKYKNDINKNMFIILFIVNINILLSLNFSGIIDFKKASYSSSFKFMLILKVLYITLPINMHDIKMPNNPFKPYTLKKVYISCPEANPAPIIVPIITKLTFKLSIILLTLPLIIYMLVY